MWAQTPEVLILSVKDCQISVGHRLMSRDRRLFQELRRGAMARTIAELCPKVSDGVIRQHLEIA